jgi:hypothetical protein
MAKDNTICHTEYGEGYYKIKTYLILCGKDIVLTISGGSKYHIGATALAIPRPSLNDPQKTSATASVLSVVGHKDDELARQAALLIASTMNCIVTAVVGVHVDDASEEDIKILIENSLNTIDIIMRKLKAMPLYAG